MQLPPINGPLPHWQHHNTTRLDRTVCCPNESVCNHQIAVPKYVHKYNTNAHSINCSSVLAPSTGSAILSDQQLFYWVSMWACLSANLSAVEVPLFGCSCESGNSFLFLFPTCWPTSSCRCCAHWLPNRLFYWILILTLFMFVGHEYGQDCLHLCGFFSLQHCFNCLNCLLKSVFY